MSKSVRLTPGKAPDSKPDPSQGFSVPPPATLPRGIRGTPPLPVGKVVTEKIQLTDRERRELIRLGWQEGQPVPKNMAEIVAEVEADSRQDAMAAANRLPVAPDTPPVKFEPVDLNSLSPSRQAEFQKKIEAAVMNERAEAAAQANQTQQGMPAAALQVGKTVNVPPEPLANPPRNFIPDPNYRPPVETPQPAAAAPQPAAAAENESLGPVNNSCPHCGWDLGLADIPPPDYEEKMRFAVAFNGGKPYTRTYPLMGGATTITFRTLTARELDTCYRQAYAERDKGDITTPLDFMERLNRFRLYLQLRRLGSHEMPDGLSEKTNPKAESYWVPDDPATVNLGTPLPQIEESMLREVLTNESLLRVANQLCIDFNRLVAKLEAMVTNSDFWKRTDSLS